MKQSRFFLTTFLALSLVSSSIPAGASPEPFDPVRPEHSRRTLRQAGIESDEQRQGLARTLRPASAAGLEADFEKVRKKSFELLEILEQVSHYQRNRKLFGMEDLTSFRTVTPTSLGPLITPAQATAILKRHTGTFVAFRSAMTSGPTTTSNGMVLIRPRSPLDSSRLERESRILDDLIRNARLVLEGGELLFRGSVHYGEIEDHLRHYKPGSVKFSIPGFAGTGTSNPGGAVDFAALDRAARVVLAEAGEPDPDAYDYHMTIVEGVASFSLGEKEYPVPIGWSLSQVHVEIVAALHRPAAGLEQPTGGRFPRLLLTGETQRPWKPFYSRPTLVAGEILRFVAKDKIAQGSTVIFSQVEGSGALGLSPSALANAKKRLPPGLIGKINRALTRLLREDKRPDPSHRPEASAYWGIARQLRRRGITAVQIQTKLRRSQYSLSDAPELVQRLLRSLEKRRDLTGGLRIDLELSLAAAVKLLGGRPSMNIFFRKPAMVGRMNLVLEEELRKPTNPALVQALKKRGVESIRIVRTRGKSSLFDSGLLTDRLLTALLKEDGLDPIERVNLGEARRLWQRTSRRPADTPTVSALSYSISRHNGEAGLVYEINRHLSRAFENITPDPELEPKARVRWGKAQIFRERGIRRILIARGKAGRLGRIAAAGLEKFGETLGPDGNTLDALLENFRSEEGMRNLGFVQRFLRPKVEPLTVMPYLSFLSLAQISQARWESPFFHVGEKALRGGHEITPSFAGRANAVLAAVLYDKDQIWRHDKEGRLALIEYVEQYLPPAPTSQVSAAGLEQWKTRMVKELGVDLSKVPTSLNLTEDSNVLLVPTKAKPAEPRPRAIILFAHKAVAETARLLLSWLSPAVTLEVREISDNDAAGTIEKLAEAAASVSKDEIVVVALNADDLRISDIQYPENHPLIFLMKRGVWTSINPEALERLLAQPDLPANLVINLTAGEVPKVTLPDGDEYYLFV